MEIYTLKELKRLHLKETGKLCNEKPVDTSQATNYFKTDHVGIHTLYHLSLIFYKDEKFNQFLARKHNVLKAQTRTFKIQLQKSYKSTLEKISQLIRRITSP